MAWGRELRKGTLDMAILALLRDTAGHGYALIQRLQAVGLMPEEGAQATVYQALQRLAKEGLLHAIWTTPEDSARPRKEYKTTHAGHQALAQMLQEWRVLAVTMNAILGENDEN